MWQSNKKTELRSADSEHLVVIPGAFDQGGIALLARTF